MIKLKAMVKIYKGFLLYRDRAFNVVASMEIPGKIFNMVFFIGIWNVLFEILNCKVFISAELLD